MGVESIVLDADSYTKFLLAIANVKVRMEIPLEICSVEVFEQQLRRPLIGFLGSEGGSGGHNNGGWGEFQVTHSLGSGREVRRGNS